MRTIKEQIQQAIKELQTGELRLIVLVSDNCKFCKQYIESLSIMQLKSQYEIMDAQKTKAGNVLTLLLAIDKLPATIIMGQDNKVKGVAYGIMPEAELNNLLEKEKINAKTTI